MVKAAGTDERRSNLNELFKRSGTYTFAPVKESNIRIHFTFSENASQDIRIKLKKYNILNIRIS